MSYQAEEIQLIQLAQRVAQNGFSFGQDGDDLSAMALILHARGIEAGLQAERDKFITFIETRLRVFASEFNWPVDRNDKYMLRAFAQLVVGWPELLG